MSKNKVRKGREGKGREGKEREGKERKNFGWHFHASLGEMGWSDHYEILHTC